MAYTKKDFKVYGERPLVDTNAKNTEGKFSSFAGKGYFDYTEVGGSQHHRKVRWFKIGDSLDKEVEVLAEDIIDLRNYNSGGGSEEFSYSDFHSYIESEYPNLYNDNDTRWLLNTTTMISDRDASEKRKNFAFFDVVDDELVVRIVSASTYLVDSDKRRSGYDTQYEVEDVLFFTVRKRPVFFVYDLDKEIFIKKTKGEIMDGLNEEYKTVIEIDGFLDFVVAETIVNGDTTMESLRKAIIKHQTYSEYESVIKFLVFEPFTNEDLINGEEVYIRNVYLSSLYNDVKYLATILEEGLSRQYVIDMITRLGFFLDIRRFDNMLPRFGLHEISDNMNIEDALKVDQHIVENLSYFIHYEKSEHLKNSEKAMAFLELLITAKSLNENGIDTTIIIDNMSKLYSNLEYDLRLIFKHDMYNALTNKVYNDEVEVRNLMNETILRIFEASDERFIDMYVITKMYRRFLTEVDSSEMLKTEFHNLNIKEAFDFLFPIDIQLSLNKLGVYGDRY